MTYCNTQKQLQFKICAAPPAFELLDLRSARTAAAWTCSASTLNPSPRCLGHHPSSASARRCRSHPSCVRGCCFGSLLACLRARHSTGRHTRTYVQEGIRCERRAALCERLVKRTTTLSFAVVVIGLASRRRRRTAAAAETADGEAASTIGQGEVASVSSNYY